MSDTQKYRVRKCDVAGCCRGWYAEAPSGYVTHWRSWARAMLRATKEY